MIRRSRNDSRKGAKDAKDINSKLEIRNSKQIQILKNLKIPNGFILDFDFEFRI